MPKTLQLQGYVADPHFSVILSVHSSGTPTYSVLSGIWRPEIEKRSDGDDDSKTDQRAAKYEIVSKCDPR
ncbi:MAG: hypothetical protein ABSF68_14660 [Candidatus Acidiferrales bacterium]